MNGRGEECLDLSSLTKNLPENMAPSPQQQVKKPYTSCIKINGRRCLPPLMTDERRIEMENYRKQALLIEEEIKKSKELKQKQVVVSRPSSLDLTIRNKSKSIQLPFVVSPKRSTPTSTLAHQVAALDVEDSSEMYSSFDSSSIMTTSQTSEKSIFSPLKVDNVKDLRLNNSLEEAETSATITPSSPKLLRQNSFTVLTPSPALISYMESQKKARKTWDLNHAKKKWLSDSDSDFQSPKKKFSPRKSKMRNMRTMSHEGRLMSSDEDTVPCNQVPYRKQSQGMEMSTQTVQKETVPLTNNNETDGFPNLNELLVKLKSEHERQKKELEERQSIEQQAVQKLQLELLHQRMMIRSQSLDAPSPGPFKLQRCQTADGRYNHVNNNHLSPALDLNQRPQSARDIYFKKHPNYVQHEMTRSLSVELDKHLARPTQGSPCMCRVRPINPQEEETLGLISDTEFSEMSSSMSSECRQDIGLIERLNTPMTVRYHTRLNIPPGQFERYNAAAVIIQAGIRGYLVRRLKRTLHVQNLLRTMNDAVHCAGDIRTDGSGMGQHDVEFMHRLGRQIEAAWEKIYEVFATMSTREKLSLIAADRERIKALEFKRTFSSPVVSNKRRISSATKKSLERKHCPTMAASYHGSSSGSTCSKQQDRMVVSCDSTPFRRLHCTKRSAKLH